MIPSPSVTPITVPVFTAAQIARAAGISKRHVLEILALVPASGVKTVSGNAASSWSLNSLPSSIQQKLERVVKQKGYRSAFDLLEAPTERWSPQVSLKDIAETDLAYAQKLRECLREILSKMGDLNADLRELKKRALDAFAGRFGYSVQEPRLNQLLRLVLERDRGLEDWTRLEIFLPEKIKLKKADRKIVRFSGRFELLEDALRDLSPSEQSLDQIAYVWKAAVESVQELVAAGNREKPSKARIVDYLRLNAPWIGRTAEAIHRNLNRKLERANEGGVAELRDKRLESSGNYRRKNFSADKLLLTKVASRHEGNISLANRLLHVGWKCPYEGHFYQYSEAYRTERPLDCRKNKSRVDELTRVEVSGPVKAVGPSFKGPRASKMARPSRLRDWSEVEPGDWHISDDETSNSMCWWADEAGQYECEWGRFNVGRPQILPLYDVASEMPLSLIVSPTKGYSADTIRDLVVPAWLSDSVGMPFKGAYFEGGVWQSRNVKALVDWSKIDAGFARAGIELSIRHATTARAKPIERIFGVEQSRMASLPGYIGRGRKGEHYERVHRALQSLKHFGQPRKECVDPRDHFLSIEEFTGHYQSVMVELSREPQNGERFRGRSPEEVWNESLAQSKPREVLPPSLEYLLATKTAAAQVSPGGIILTIGGKRFQYCASERLGLLVERTLSIRYRGREPDHIVVIDPVLDPKGIAPFVVPLSERLPAMSASREDFARAAHAESVFTAPQKALYRLIAPPNNLTRVRADLGTEELRATGIAHQRAEEGFAESVRSERALRPKAEKLGRRFGIDTKGSDPAKVVRSLEGLDEIESRLAAEESAQQENETNER